MENRFSVAVIGCGEFARNFVPLFKAHPAVTKVYVCDVIPERALAYSQKYGVEIIESFEKALIDDRIDAVALFTQRHLHGPMVVNALKAGKHVYSAVPMASSVEDCRDIIDTVKATKRVYMMGETCVYYPCAMFCKQQYDAGLFGNFVYGESQYFHDLSHFPKDYQNDIASETLPPFFYPTHSTAMLLWATGAYATRVSAMGYSDKEPNTNFTIEKSPWSNTFSNEFSLMQLSNGGVARVCECRRIGYKAPSSFISGFYGSQASYQFNNAQHLITKLTPSGVELSDVSAQVNPHGMEDNRSDTQEFKNRVANHTWQWDSFSPIQNEDIARLPESFRGLPNGHMASHQFLIDDFCTAVQNNTIPKVNAILAARYTVPGLLAHESAKNGGMPIDIPYFGGELY